MCRLVVVAAAVFWLAGCGSSLPQRTAIGALGGAVVGQAVGDAPLAGAAAGAAIGALSP